MQRPSHPQGRHRRARGPAPRAFSPGDTLVHRRRPELSQHFLRSDEARRIVAGLPWSAGDLVVEVGAGRGAITAPLAEAGFRVIAIEKDVRLFRELSARLIGRTNVECHRADVLDFALPRAPYRLVSNVPYAITAVFVRKLLQASPPPLDAYLIVQREAGEKFTGTPYESLISLLHKPAFDISIVDSIPRGAFSPPTSVDSVLLRIEQRARPLVAAPRCRAYRGFITEHFARRRTVRASLRGTLTYRQLRRLAGEHNFSPSARCAELTFSQWLAIFRFVEHVCLGRDPNRMVALGHIHFAAALA